MTGGGPCRTRRIGSARPAVAWNKKAAVRRFTLTASGIGGGWRDLRGSMQKSNGAGTRCRRQRARWRLADARPHGTVDCQLRRTADAAASAPGFRAGRTVPVDAGPPECGRPRTSSSFRGRSTARIQRRRNREADKLAALSAWASARGWNWRTIIGRDRRRRPSFAAAIGETPVLGKRAGAVRAPFGGRGARSPMSMAGGVFRVSRQGHAAGVRNFGGSTHTARQLARKPCG